MIKPNTNYNRLLRKFCICLYLTKPNIHINSFTILNLVQIRTYGKVRFCQKIFCHFHTRPEIWSHLRRMTRETIFEGGKKWMFSNHFTRRLGWLKTSIPKRLRAGLCTVFLAQSIMNGVLSLQVWKLGIRKHLIYQNAKILINFSLFL